MSEWVLHYTQGSSGYRRRTSSQACGLGQARTIGGKPPPKSPDTHSERDPGAPQLPLLADLEWVHGPHSLSGPRAYINLVSFRPSPLSFLSPSSTLNSSPLRATMATQFSDTKGQVARTNSDEKLGGQDEHLENPTLAEKGVTGSGVFCSAEDVCLAVPSGTVSMVAVLTRILSLPALPKSPSCRPCERDPFLLPPPLGDMLAQPPSRTTASERRRTCTSSPSSWSSISCKLRTRPSLACKRSRHRSLATAPQLTLLPYSIGRPSTVCDVMQTSLAISTLLSA